LKIGWLASGEARNAKTKDVKMQKRSHHVIENKGSGLGSFSKQTHFRGERAHFGVPTNPESGNESHPLIIAFPIRLTLFSGLSYG
jgi:hypothetical protein